MVRWRRKIKMKMRVNSVNGRRKDEGGRESQKKKKEKKEKKKRETRKVQGQNLAPTLKLSKLLSQLQFFFFLFLFFFFFSFPLQKKSHHEKRRVISFSKKKKERKKKIFLERIKDKRFKVQIFSNPKSQIFNSKFSFLISKISSFNFQISKFQNL